MSRLAYKNSIKSVLEEVKLPQTFAQTLETIDATLATIPPSEQRNYINDIYTKVIADKSIPQRLQDHVAYLHGSLNLGTSIMRDESDFKELKVKGDPLDIVVFMDHSGSMAGNRTITLVNQILTTLYEKQANGATVKIYMFGSGEHEIGKYLTPDEYKSGINANRYRFNGGTDFVPAWGLCASQPTNCIAIIVSDGDFNGRPLTDLVLHPGMQAIIFYAPEWSTPDVTKRHSSSLSKYVNESAVYNGDILPGNIIQLSQVIDTYATSRLIPNLPGRTRIGTISIPTKFLLPSYFNKVLNSILTIPKEEAIPFYTKVLSIYDQIYTSARQDIERCFTSPLFAEFMSLNPTIIKFSEATLGENKAPDLSNSIGTLLKMVIIVKDFISTEKPKLCAKYPNDKAKLELFEALFQKATTVSERNDIIEKKGDPVAYLTFPHCTNMDALVALFHRMRTLHCPPDSVELDHMLISLFTKVYITNKSYVSTDYEVPMWLDSKGEVDIYSAIRLFPGYLRSQQELNKTTISPDYTFQARTVNRIMCILQVAEIQGAIYPTWLSKSLSNFKLPDSLTNDKEDENITVYWMNILKQLSIEKGLTVDQLVSINNRLTAIAIKFYTIKNVEEKVLNYTKPMYPGVKPFIETKEPSAYIVYTDKQGSYVDCKTGSPYSKATTLTKQGDIDRAYERNLDKGGAYIRPTYLTDGNVTLWDESGPNKEQILTDQLISLNYSQLEINAHLHTLRNMNLVKVVRYGQNVEEELKSIQVACNKAPILTEDVSVTVPRNTIIQMVANHHPTETISRILRGTLDYTYADKKVWSNDVDYLLACGNGDIKLSECPMAVYPDNSGARDLFNSHVKICDDAIKRTLTPPVFMGSSRYIVDNNYNEEKKEVKKEEKKRDDLEVKEKKEDEVKIDSSKLDCPILLQRMKDPGMCIPCGHTFERYVIDQIFDKGNPCPLCNGKITLVSPNFILKDILNSK